MCIAGAMAACSGGPRSFEQMDGFVTPLSVEPPPIYALMGFRAELGLSSEQVAGLDEIAIEVQDLNRPHLDDLQQNVRRASREPGVFRVTPETEPVVEEIRTNNLRASEAVAGLLTEAQRAEVCDLFQRGQLARRRGSANAEPVRADSVAPAAARTRSTIWHWCAPGADDRGPARATAAS